VTSPWAPPGSAPAQPAPAPALAAVDAAVAAHRPAAPALPPVPVPLGPMTLPDLLDGAFAIVKRRPRDVVVLAAAVVVPVEVLSALLLRDVFDAGALAGVDDPTTALGTQDGEVVGTGAALASVAVGALSLVLLAGALGVLVDGWYRGRHVGAGEALAAALRRSPALLLGTVLVHLLEGVGFLALGVGAYVAMALLHVASPAVTVEGLGPWRSVRRSVQLTRRRIGPALVVPGVVGIVGMGVALGFQAVPELAAAVVPDDWDWLVRASGSLAAQLVVAPFTAGVAVLFHLDLRVRTEALDIELRARALG